MKIIMSEQDGQPPSGGEITMPYPCCGHCRHPRHPQFTGHPSPCYHCSVVLLRNRMGGIRSRAVLPSWHLTHCALSLRRT